MLKYIAKDNLKYMVRGVGGLFFWRDRERILEVSKSLSTPRIKLFLGQLEKHDPQYHVVTNILKKIEDPFRAFTLIIAVSLVSYQLSTKGEEHWNYLETFVSKHKELSPREISLLFLEKSPSMRRLKTVKEARLQRFFKLFAPVFQEKFQRYVEDLNLFRRDLAHLLNTDPDSKTIVFSVKMFHYALEASGLKHTLPFKIPLPADHRVCLISLTSGIIKTFDYISGFSRLANILLSRKSGEVKKAWSEVSEKTGIPPLLLDTLLWITGGFAEKVHFNLERTIEKLEKLINRRLTTPEKNVIKELLAMCAKDTM
ncbi:MAG: hypothetical protein DRJ47_01150 [Thermoprotei archaeon]|nr:MAG: hypothetical protein DRJ47_01150 [Thermoprotei archaeon]